MRYCDSALDRPNELRLNDDLSGQLAVASKNIKTAISRINYAWNLRNSPIFRLPDLLVLRIFEQLQGLAYRSPSKTHSRWWEWLKVMSVCRAWWRISLEGSSLWENVHILYKLPVPFLGLILDRAGGRRLAIHFQSCDYLHSRVRREGYLKAIRSIADRIKNFTVHVTASGGYWEMGHLPALFAIPYPNLESLDLSYNAFYSSSSWDMDPQYRPDISNVKHGVMLELISLMPTEQLKRLTLRHMGGWPPTQFGNLTSLALFGYADGATLAEAVWGNPALRKLKLESIKHEERYSYDPRRLVELNGQTLELERCDPDVLRMFSLSSTCSLIVTKSLGQQSPMDQGEVPELRWLPEDISAIRCLHDLREVHFNVTKMPGRVGWVASEQNTVCYSASSLTSGSNPEPSATFTLTYHSEAFTIPCEVQFEPRYLLPHPTPWGQVIRASFNDFHDQFRIRDKAVLETLPNLRSLIFRRCDNGQLVRSITPNELRGLESLCFEDELSGADFGDALSIMLGLRHKFAGLQLKDLKIVTPGGPSSIITVEQMGKLGGFVCRVEAIQAPGYRPVVT